MPDDQKSLCRQRMRLIRRGLGEAARREASARIVERVLAWHRVADARLICCYVSAGEEVGTRELIETLLSRGQAVAAPLTLPQRRMIARPIRTMDELRPGRFGLLEPPPGEPAEPDLCIIPAVAMSEQGHRLGMGAGYYDRFLAAHPQTFRLALAFQAQLVQHLPVEPHDQPMHAFASETRLVELSGG